MAATYGSLNVSLSDYKGKAGICKVRVPIAKATDANAKKIADFLKTHSDARVTSYGITKDYDGDTVDSGKYDRCLQRLVMFFEDEKGQNRSFSIPAPRDEDVDDDQEPTSDLPEDVKDLLVSVGAVSSVVYNGGGMRSRVPSKQARKKIMTGV
jgi:hypothetical protein